VQFKNYDTMMLQLQEGTMYDFHRGALQNDTTHFVITVAETRDVVKKITFTLQEAVDGTCNLFEKKFLAATGLFVHRDVIVCCVCLCDLNYNVKMSQTPFRKECLLVMNSRKCLVNNLR
jgi:hypothetical protein